MPELTGLGRSQYGLAADRSSFGSRVTPWTRLQLMASALTLLGLAIVGVMSSRRTAERTKQAICMAKLQEIGDALRTYFERHGAYPEERPGVDWLAALMPGGGRPSCPCEDRPGSSSYQNSYVRRPPGAGESTHEHRGQR